MSDTPRFADMIDRAVRVAWKNDPSDGYATLFELLAVDRDLRMVALRRLDDPDEHVEESDGYAWYPVEDMESIETEDDS